jgi:hypothetical protein
VHRARNAVVARHEEVRDSASGAVEFRYVRGGSARQFGMRDDLTAKCGEA